MNRDQAIEYIHSVSWRGSRPGLERIRELCSALGDPQDYVPSVHVAGTNGKGSVCSMLSSILRAAGYRTGLFTSPYVSFFEERIRLDGEPIPGDELGAITERVAAAAEKMADPPTEFELLTAVGFEYFKKSRCDVAVIETGLGGRLDSTNVIKEPLVSVITGIGLDHTAILGDTEEKIAREKAGIVKPGVPVIAGRASEGALSVIKRRAEELSCPFFCATSDRFSDPELFPTGSSFSAEPYGKLRIGLAGIHQLDNASVALRAAETLRDRGLAVPDEAIKKGLADARWRARFETLCVDPLVVYDGAHNPDGIRALCENVRTLLGGGAILVFGVMEDKDYRSMIKAVSRVARYAFTVKPDNPRSLDPGVSASLFSEEGVGAAVCPSVEDGIARAVGLGRMTGAPVLIMGTLYMYAEAEPAVRRIAGK